MPRAARPPTSTLGLYLVLLAHACAAPGGDDTGTSVGTVTLPDVTNATTATGGPTPTSGTSGATTDATSTGDASTTSAATTADPTTGAGTTAGETSATTAALTTGGTQGETTTATTTGDPPPACEPDRTPPPGDCAAMGIVIDPVFAQHYTCFDLGTLAAIPTPWGGFASKDGDPGTLLITGGSRSATGRLYAVPIGRDADCHVAGFTGEVVDIAEAPYNEAGVAYGPDGVLFLAQAVVNRIGQLEPGSAVTDKVVDVGALGHAATSCGVNFVPPGFPGAGQLKLVNWPAPGSWYDAPYVADGAGTFDITAVNQAAALPGGAAGFVFIAAGNVDFPANTVLVSEYNTGTVVAYDLVGASDPDPATRRVFISGLSGAQGGVVDPVSGDFLFSTFSTARIIAIRGFKPLPG
jgi:hypothetical protein